MKACWLCLLTVLFFPYHSIYAVEPGSLQLQVQIEKSAEPQLQYQPLEMNTHVWESLDALFMQLHWSIGAMWFAARYMPSDPVAFSTIKETLSHRVLEECEEVQVLLRKKEAASFRFTRKERKEPQSHQGRHQNDPPLDLSILPALETTAPAVCPTDSSLLTELFISWMEADLQAGRIQPFPSQMCTQGLYLFSYLTLDFCQKLAYE